MVLDLDDKVVLVTGASRGIGATIAQAFAQQGANVVVNYLQNETAARAVVAACDKFAGSAMRVQADVSDADAVRTLIAEVVDNFGKIDVLVNNAFRPYVFSPEERTRFPDLAWEHYQSQFDGAVPATFSMCQAVLPFMQRQARGSIINMTSDLVERPSIAYHDYATAKSALVGFSRNLAAEVGAFGVRVNCVAPGLVYPTGASRATKEGVKEMLIAQTPLKRIATPSDITGPVLFLASNWSQFITGQTLVVDGGLVMT